jgi:hypothetical protein
MAWKKVVVSGSAISQLTNDAGYLASSGQGIVSSSAQTIGHLNGSQIVSSSAQIDDLFNIDGVLSSSAQIAELGAGIVSSSTQTIANLNGSEIVSSSTQIDGLGFLKVEGDAVVSSSAQINVTNTIVDAAAAIEYTKLDFEGSGFISSSGQLGVNNSSITVSGSLNGGVLVNGGAADVFTLNQASDATLVISLVGGVVSGSADGDNQGEVKINGVARSTGLKTTDSVTFATASITQNLTVGGNLYVDGDITNVNTTDLNVEDKWILLASGSNASAGDAGIIVEQTAIGEGAAFGWDNSEGRFGFDAAGADAATNTVDFDAYAAAVVTTSANTGSYAKAGNMLVEGGEIYIFV